ncbi:MAG: glucose-1-phosphate adenylyltransferase [Luteitalea sp.]
MSSVLTLILGGGRGNRLFPLTRSRSKPAVPIGGKYRLIDVPVSNCLHAGFRRIFVLTQFNSASLNRHVAQSYRLDHFSQGFVDILAAEQTPDSTSWFQGTADAVRQAWRHFNSMECDHILILAGDHLYRMNLRELITDHVEQNADVTIAAQPCDAETSTQMGIFRFDASGQISGFEEKPDLARLGEIGQSAPARSRVASWVTPQQPFIASMGIYVFSRQVLLDALERYADAVDFGKEIIPAVIDTHRVRAYLYRGYWADVGTMGSFFEANLKLTDPRPQFTFHDQTCPIYTHPRFLAGSTLQGCRVDQALIAEGCWLDQCQIDRTVVGIRSVVRAGARISQSVLLGADYYAEATAASGVALGIGRDVVLDRVIVDKNARIGDGARLVNSAGVKEKDGDGYFIREGIIIVPKGATIAPGTDI